MSTKNSKDNSPWFWIRGSNGEKSVTLTFATVSFLITSAAYLTSMLESVGTVTFKQFDVAACGSYFGTIMALYFGRRWTEAKYTQAPQAGSTESTGVINENK